MKNDKVVRASEMTEEQVGQYMANAVAGLIPLAFTRFEIIQIGNQFAVMLCGAHTKTGEPAKISVGPEDAMFLFEQALDASRTAGNDDATLILSIGKHAVIFDPHELKKDVAALTRQILKIKKPKRSHFEKGTP